MNRDFTEDPLRNKSGIIDSLKKWRATISPIIGVLVVCLFLSWVWMYRKLILVSLQNLGGIRLVALTLLILAASVLTAMVLVTLVRSKGYSFSFYDGFEVLYLSQLASLIPGGIWGFAGFAGILWSKGVAKVDSAVIILLNTMIMLTACVMVGFSGLITIIGWGYSVICVLPFLVLLLGRDRLDSIRGIYFPQSSRLPSVRILVKTLVLGLVVWLLSSSCFAWLLYTNEDIGSVPFWIVAGSYAAGYLGGYLAIFIPSGLGVSEGITTYLLSSYLPVDRILAVAVTYRIIHTFVVLCNIFLAVRLNAGKKPVGSTS